MLALSRGEVGGRLSLRREMPPFDARPGADPFVGRLDDRLEFGVRDDTVGQIVPDAPHHGAYCHSALPRIEQEGLKPAIKSLQRDIAAMEVHADFVSQRVALATDATLGMINLAQNATVKIVSVVAVLFLPPTLVASIYGMNFAHMPELERPWGYPGALGLMLASAAGAWAYFKWKKWL